MLKLLTGEALMRVFVKNLDIGIWGSSGGPPLLSLLVCEMMLIPCICVQEHLEARGQPRVSSFRYLFLYRSLVGLELSWLSKEPKEPTLPQPWPRVCMRTTPLTAGIVGAFCHTLIVQCCGLTPVLRRRGVNSLLSELHSSS